MTPELICAAVEEIGKGCELLSITEIAANDATKSTRQTTKKTTTGLKEEDDSLNQSADSMKIGGGVLNSESDLQSDAEN